MRGGLINTAPHFRNDHIRSLRLLADSLYFISVSRSTSLFFVSRKNRIHFPAQPPSFCSKSDESSFLLLIVFSAILFAYKKKKSCFPPLLSLKKDAGGKIFLLCLKERWNWEKWGDRLRFGGGIDGSESSWLFVLANRWKWTLTGVWGTNNKQALWPRAVLEHEKWRTL